MATIDKLEYLDETKNQIKSVLNNLGAKIDDSDTFRSYVTKINELYEEYPTEEFIQNLQSIQLQNIQSQIIDQPLEMQPLDLDIEPLNIEIEPSELETQSLNIEENQEEITPQDEEVE